MQNPGFQHWFCVARDAVIGFVPRSSVWVVGGAPVCAAERLDSVAEEFEKAARRVGARVCYVGAQDRLARRCLGQGGYAATVLGAEPWRDPAEWPALIAAHPSLRAQRNRARNKGITVAVVAMSGEETRRLEGPLREWLGSKGLPPLAFLTTPWLLADLRDRRIVLAERRGVTVGFLVLTPIHGRRFYDFEGLRSFKAKLGPIGWAPVDAIANEERIGFRTMLGVAGAVVGGDLVRFGAHVLRHALRSEVHRMTTGAP